MSRDVLRAFSTRRREIEMHLEEHGETSARAAQVAAYATRRAKDVETRAESLLPEWRDRARSLGLDQQALAAALDHCIVPSVPHPASARAEALFAQLAAPSGLTARSASFGRREVLQALSAALPNGGDIDEILDLADAFLSSRHVVSLDPAGLRTGDVIRRHDGAVVVTHVDEARWSTPEMLATEARLIDAALESPGRCSRRRRPSACAKRDRHPSVARGRAGAHAEADHRLRCRGRRRRRRGGDRQDLRARRRTRSVGSLGLSRWSAARWLPAAAAELEHGAAIPSMTLDRLLRHLDHPDDFKLDGSSVVVVDEASMIGTRKLARLLDHAEMAGAKVVLVGDHYQLPEIDAGGAFAGLAARLHASRARREPSSDRTMGTCHPRRTPRRRRQRRVRRLPGP